MASAGRAAPRPSRTRGAVSKAQLEGPLPPPSPLEGSRGAHPPTPPLPARPPAPAGGAAGSGVGAPRGRRPCPRAGGLGEGGEAPRRRPWAPGSAGGERPPRGGGRAHAAPGTPGRPRPCTACGSSSGRRSRPRPGDIEVPAAAAAAPPSPGGRAGAAGPKGCLLRGLFSGSDVCLPARLLKFFVESSGHLACFKKRGCLALLTRRIPTPATSLGTCVRSSARSVNVMVFSLCVVCIVFTRVLGLGRCGFGRLWLNPPGVLCGVAVKFVFNRPVRNPKCLGWKLSYSGSGTGSFLHAHLEENEGLGHFFRQEMILRLFRHVPRH